VFSSSRINITAFASVATGDESVTRALIKTHGQKCVLFFAGWRLCDRLAPFVLAAYARAKSSLLLYLACVTVLVSAVLRGSLLYVSMWLSVMT